MTRLSIAIPTYNYHGKGEQFLEDLLRTIQIQTFRDFEIVISDHSEDEIIKNKAEEYSDFFSVKYLANTEKRGNSPANLNHAISHCSGEIIKPMFQDDFFYDDEALAKIYYNLAGDRNKFWLLNGTNHTTDNGHSFFWNLFPRFNPNLLMGVNTISSPSVLAYKREVEIKFDEDLVYLMDIDFYYNMRETYGEPIYYDDVLVTNRIHPDSISNTINNKEELLQKESDYCRKKYD
jgi:glycosyltransferase involved in cell wall biosynthesis